MKSRTLNKPNLSHYYIGASVSQNQSQNHLIDLPLQGVNSLFVLSIENLTNKLK